MNIGNFQTTKEDMNHFLRIISKTLVFSSNMSKKRKIQALNNLDRVILLVNGMAIKGNTRMQKYGFLTAQLYYNELKNLNFYSDWRPHSYGPYSDELANDVTLCVENDLIQLQEEKTPNDRTVSTYSLKIKGRQRLNKLSKNYANIIKDLYEKFTELNRQKTDKILRDIYEAYPSFTVNSMIKEDVLESPDEFSCESNFENELLNQSIEQKIKSIQSENVKGKKYTVSEYLAHIDQILQD